MRKTKETASAVRTEKQKFFLALGAVVNEFMLLRGLATTDVVEQLNMGSGSVFAAFLNGEHRLDIWVLREICERVLHESTQTMYTLTDMTLVSAQRVLNRNHEVDPPLDFERVVLLAAASVVCSHAESTTLSDLNVPTKAES